MNKEIYVNGLRTSLGLDDATANCIVDAMEKELDSLQSILEEAISPETEMTVGELVSRFVDYVKPFYDCKLSETETAAAKDMPEEYGKLMALMLVINVYPYQNEVSDEISCNNDPSADMVED